MFEGSTTISEITSTLLRLTDTEVTKVKEKKIEKVIFHTCQKMLSIVLPRKPSLVSDERSLGPSIVTNSSKSTCPSPAARKTCLKTDFFTTNDATHTLQHL